MNDAGRFRLPGDKPPLLVLVGPTAIGKTGLSIELAKRYGCEIISGDSMQVYRGMDIGTAKITREEMQGVPHHMVDICEPDYPFSVAEFQERVRQLILDIGSRGAIPFIVGGTGLYIESICYDFQFTDVGSDEEFRQEQRQYLEEHGPEALHARLAERDPGSAARLHANDTRRVIRALEVLHLTGRTLTEQLAGQTKESPYNLCLTGLTMDRDILYNRIEARIDKMMELGLVEEVKGLLARGITRSHISMQGLGYKEIAAYLDNEMSLPEAVRLLKRDTRHFAKRQLSWFRHMKDINWIEIPEHAKVSRILHKFHEILAGKFEGVTEYIGEHEYPQI
ncbi:tRNA (adenosine(37)-N6)-dimethylallyltransferase MiaA [Paenibacillus sp. YN15]|uniref:tRNA (adenosine(37)-N6)-dimethylallyltransferase MiaA n=1 Tax=Paenibacillus sp. YN15 TaxID=1742774 RepID=UPI000DCD77E9|nr:tRNA (adenosine(37)-N6)-dimethylallyltransferase MiaA [Paenibacillus sp. YN15]RAV02377.1 tRNA (adenosine(37)-N6)-dimethylallyltransferase MiaA [Paenibacillus sp. YN15]